MPEWSKWLTIWKMQQLSNHNWDHFCSTIDQWEPNTQQPISMSNFPNMHGSLKADPVCRLSPSPASALQDILSICMLDVMFEGSDNNIEAKVYGDLYNVECVVFFI